MGRKKKEGGLREANGIVICGHCPELVISALSIDVAACLLIELIVFLLGKLDVYEPTEEIYYRMD